MKKLFSILLIVALLACMTTGFAGSAGTASDPLITRSYVTGDYSSQLATAINETAHSAFDSIYDATSREISRISDNYMLLSGGYFDYTLTDGYIDIALSAGECVYLRTGASFILTSGTATLTIYDGSVINASKGSRVLSGTSAIQYNRYFCTESTRASFTAVSDCVFQVDGYYMLGGEPTDNQLPFRDVSSNIWYFGSVNYAYQNDLFRGITETTFEPNTTMSRGMFVTVLYRLSGEPDVSGSLSFTDVEAGRYYSDAAVWAANNDILLGYEDNTFRPDVPVTREQMAVLLYRYASYIDCLDGYVSHTIFQSFPDADQTSNFAKAGLTWATSKGVLNGSSGELLPKDPATRAQVAQIILNFNAQILEN